MPIHLLSSFKLSESTIDVLSRNEISGTVDDGGNMKDFSVFDRLVLELLSR